MDDRIRAGIFAGESGGDYNALYGFQNRRPGAPQVSEMTLGQVMDFTDPSGGYGQGVKDQIGRVATPVGAYQVVGTTLRAAVKDLGLDPNRKFDKETQDLIGDWVLRNQGTGAWAGYRGPSEPGAPTMSAKNPGRGGAGGGMAMDPTVWQSIIDASRNQKRSPKAGLANALMAFAQNAPSMYRGGSMDFSGFAGQGNDRRTKNATVEWLQAAGRPDLAAAIAAGSIEPKEAVALAYSKDGAVSGVEVNGKLVNPQTGEVIYDGTDGRPPIDKELLNAANTIRDDINTDMKLAQDVRSGADTIETFYKNPGAVSDYALAVAFAKIVDPGSVAREGEVAAVQGAGSYLPAALQKLWANTDWTGKTGRMAPEMRNEIVRLAAGMANSRLAMSRDKLGRWQATTQQMGIPWEWVWQGGDLPDMQVPTGAAGPATTPPPQTTPPPTGGDPAVFDPNLLRRVD